ncbi:MAG TPA: hypothetical protein VGG19_10720 [Tepidisphaeraceae bacterium]|jgi:hypothetical protein
MLKTLMPPSSEEIAARLEEMLSKVTAKDRAGVEKHLALCDAERDAAHGEVWRRLAGLLGGLVSLPAKTSGATALTFFIPDGKYRNQVFALEDRRDGTLLLYVPDVIDKAVRQNLLAKGDGFYTLPGSDRLFAQVIDGSLPELPNHIKPMLGWNRKAIRISINTDFPDKRQLTTAELLCCLAAENWAGPSQ